MIAPPRPPSPDELEALIKEARDRQRRRRMHAAAVVAVAVGVGLAASALVPGGGQPQAKPQANGEGGSLSQPASSCDVRVSGARILNGNGGVLYREPGPWTHPRIHQVLCSGPTIWVVFNNGVASNQEGYVGVRSSDHGRTWKLEFSESYFGVNAPHELDAYMGPWTLVGTRRAYFTGWCPACSPKPTVSLWVTNNLGRTFHHYPVPTLAGYSPTRIRVTGRSVTISGKRQVRGVAPHKTATVRLQ